MGQRVGKRRHAPSRAPCDGARLGDEVLHGRRDGEELALGRTLPRTRGVLEDDRVEVDVRQRVVDDGGGGSACARDGRSDAEQAYSAAECRYWCVRCRTSTVRAPYKVSSGGGRARGGAERLAGGVQAFGRTGRAHRA